MITRLASYLALLSASIGAYAQSPARDHTRPVILENRKIDESSGLTASRITPGLLWSHNDSGDKARMYAFNTDGKNLGTINLDLKKPSDCEAACSFSKDGVAYLLLADVGDNRRRRKECTLMIFPEPKPDATTIPRKAIRQLRFRYADGPRDCESVSVDALRNEIVLVEKVREGTARISTLPLDAQEDEVAVAQTTGRIPIVLATGMDLSPDGNKLLIVTYGHGREWHRTHNESWATVLCKNPGNKIILPPRAQGEAVCYARDGKSIFVSSERLPALLYNIPAPTTKPPQ